MKSRYITLLVTMINDDLPDDPNEAISFIRVEKAMLSREIGDIEIKLNQTCSHNEVVGLCNNLVLLSRMYESLDAKQRRIENRIEAKKVKELAVKE